MLTSLSVLRHCSCIRFWNFWGKVQECCLEIASCFRVAFLAYSSVLTRNGHVIHVRNIIVDTAVWSTACQFSHRIYLLS